jgi:dihydroxyacid dehydratase/phosphogluconate dehydratase
MADPKHIQIATRFSTLHMSEHMGAAANKDGRVMVGVGRTDSIDGRVPAIFVYLPRKLEYLADSVQMFEGMPVVWKLDPIE